MVRKIFKTVSIDSETQHKLQSIAKIAGKSQNKILGEILAPLYSLLVSFDASQKPIGFWVDFTQSPPQVNLTVYGRSRLLKIISKKEVD